ncbi:MAG: hypothetical protein U0R44_05085 [Candidatus Micrarchaeia archaeon]
MQKKSAVRRAERPQRKVFAGMAPLAELAAGSDNEETGRFSLQTIAEAAAVKALEGGLTPEKARDVIAALPKR